MSVFAMLVLQDDGLTFREVIQNIPHDGPAIVIYLMLAAFAALVWLGSRNSGGGTPQDGSAGTKDTGKAGTTTTGRRAMPG